MECLRKHTRLINTLSRSGHSELFNVGGFSEGLIQFSSDIYAENCTAIKCNLKSITVATPAQRIVLDILNVCIGQVTFFTQIYCLILFMQRSMKCCLYKITCVYAFGSAIASLGLAFECEKCNKLWLTTVYREKMSCFYFAPNAQLYLIGNHLMECSVIALSTIVVTESRIRNSNFFLRRLRNVSICLFFIFSLTCWLVGLWLSTSMSDDQFVNSCYFVDVVERQFWLGFIVFMACSSALSLIAVFISAWHLQKRAIINDQFSALRFRRQITAHKWIFKVIFFTIIILNTPWLFEVLGGVWEIRRNAMSSFFWMLQPVMLCLFNMINQICHDSGCICQNTVSTS
ncbi:hypothetical protein T10_11768 [Trichinella papuae]|uniref:G-protein coupled receptors family 1 profile domain-containing protein n=1 Tax=Trichinella papuae TaxID=268474 RepID=A0A0V1N8X3_9BILA|nr:hypothetical protein T10_11768 [Trichinella papuae]